MKKDLAVFIGRFQPFHRGHLSVVTEALEIANKIVIIVGSAGSARTLRNPFTFEERRDMILASVEEANHNRIAILPMKDCMYSDDAWVTNIQTSVSKAYDHFYGPWSLLANKTATVTLIGHSKDQTSFYLKLFPQWDNHEVFNTWKISSTDIRDRMFMQIPDTDYTATMPVKVSHAIQNYFMKTKEFKQLCDEKAFVEQYKSQWSNSPYPPTFVTTDAIVVQSGHILLVRRKANPGKGMFALPGGFLGQDEKIVDSMIRELKEETKIKVPSKVLLGSITKREVFDDPNRSMRGRTITHAFLIQLPNELTLPQVKGGDDAEEASWVPISELKESDLFEDHYHMIMKMLN